MSERKVLNSWKEVAAYLGCGIRTAQRLEPAGLPVRRPSGRDRSAVIALKDEIDAWRLAVRDERVAAATSSAAMPSGERRQIMREQLRSLKVQMAECRQKSEELRQKALEIRTRNRAARPGVPG